MINPQKEVMLDNTKKLYLENTLQRSLTWAKEKSPFYKEILQDENFNDKDLDSLISIIKKLPILDDIYDYWDYLTLPLNNILRINEVKSTYFLLTQNDMTTTMDMTIRGLYANNINKTSVVILYGDYTKDHILNLHYSAEALGATIIPCQNKGDILKMRNCISFNAIIGDLDFYNYLNENQIPAYNYILYHDDIVEDLPIDVGYLSYHKTTGIIGMVFKCEKNHYHLNDDYILGEIIDDELIISPIYLEGMPIYRLKTGILGKKLFKGTCNCRRTLSILK